MAGWKSNQRNAGRLHAIKRGLASLFVWAVVILPLVLAGLQIKQTFFPSKPHPQTETQHHGIEYTIPQF